MEFDRDEEEEFSDTDSISDSFEDIDASGASEGILGGCIPPPETFKKRADFVNNDDYAIYVRDSAQVLKIH
jgi:E3 ubiquitin-protein ligase HERC2